MQTILGAGGMIGKLLAKELSAYTDSVRLVCRNPRRINDNDELFPVDLFEPGAVDKTVEGSDVVYLVVGLQYKLNVWEEEWSELMYQYDRDYYFNSSKLTRRFGISAIPCEEGVKATCDMYRK